MKKRKNIFIALSITVLSFANLLLLFQQHRLSAMVENLEKACNRCEWTVNDGIRCVGHKVEAAYTVPRRHMALRYDISSCMVCVADAETLLENVFGLEMLHKELSIVGIEGCESPFGNSFPFVTCNDAFTPMDAIYTPYFCLMSDSGEIIFSLILKPDNYEYNKGILERLRISFSRK